MSLGVTAATREENSQIQGWGVPAGTGQNVGYYPEAGLTPGQAGSLQGKPRWIAVHGQD